MKTTLCSKTLVLEETGEPKVKYELDKTQRVLGVNLSML